MNKKKEEVKVLFKGFYKKNFSAYTALILIALLIGYYAFVLIVNNNIVEQVKGIQQHPFPVREMCIRDSSYTKWAGVSDVVGVVSVGSSGATRQIQNVAAGQVSATSTDAVNGSQLYDCLLYTSLKRTSK